MPTDDAEEIVFSEDNNQAEKDNQADVRTALALEQKIRNTLSTLDTASEKLSEQKEMYFDAFENDPVFREHDQEYEEAKKKRRKARQEILKQPAVASMKEKTSEIRALVRELRAELSEDLQEFQRLTGNRFIENNDGETMEIVNRAKLIKRS